MEPLISKDDEYIIIDETSTMVETRIRELFLYLIRSSDGVRYSLSEIGWGRFYVLEDLYHWCSNREVDRTLFKQIKSVYLRARCYKNVTIQPPAYLWATVKKDYAAGTIMMMGSIGIVIDELTHYDSGKNNLPIESKIAILRDKGTLTSKDCRLLESLIHVSRSASEFIDIDEPDIDALLSWKSLYSKLVRTLFS